MNYLSVDQVIAIHDETLLAFKGAQGVLNKAMIEVSVHKPKITLGLKEVFPDIFSKAAALLNAITLNHGFVDGNKRTGYLTAVIFLRLNGIEIQPSDDEIIELMFRVASGGDSDIKMITAWFKRHCEGLTEVKNTSEGVKLVETKAISQFTCDPDQRKYEFTVRPGCMSKGRYFLLLHRIEDDSLPRLSILKPKDHGNHLSIEYKDDEGTINRVDFDMKPVQHDVPNNMLLDLNSLQPKLSVNGVSLKSIRLDEK